jgi:hypothetical protein
MRIQDSIPGRLLAAVVAASMAFVPVTALAQRAGRGANNPLRSIPLSGTAHVVDPNTGEPTAQTETFTGTLDIERFAAVGDQLLAIGQVNGKFSGGKPVNHQSVAIPVSCIVAGAPPNVCATSTQTTRAPDRARGNIVAPATWDPSHGTTIIPAQTGGSCDILTLVLGPLHLDLLGLVVDLNQVVLTITGDTGAGNLLGNLLCAVAGLLDGTGGLGGITGALQQIAGLLSTIANVLNQILAGL